jgi:hypothetical protein
MQAGANIFLVTCILLAEEMKAGILYDYSRPGSNLSDQWLVHSGPGLSWAPCSSSHTKTQQFNSFKPL